MIRHELVECSGGYEGCLMFWEFVYCCFPPYGDATSLPLTLCGLEGSPAVWRGVFRVAPLCNPSLEFILIATFFTMSYGKNWPNYRRVVLRHSDGADLNSIQECSSIPGFIRFFKSTYFCAIRLTHYIWRSARVRIWIKNYALGPEHVSHA
jgi:hypothetical protein